MKNFEHLKANLMPKKFYIEIGSNSRNILIDYLKARVPGFSDNTEHLLLTFEPLLDKYAQILTMAKYDRL